VKRDDPLVSSALRRAIAFCEGAVAGAVSADLVRGETPRQLRTEAGAYRKLLGTLQGTPRKERHAHE
jgi:hypothetical protein